MRSISPYERLGEPTPPVAETREHVFRAGDTLTALAHKFYGDYREWRRIAEANDIRDPRRIASGTTLTIPSMPPQRGRFASV